jgi:hypothetical protein
MTGTYRAHGRRALCCECGMLRKIDGRSARFNQTEELDDNPEYWRMTALLKCKNCGGHATHALLRPSSDPDRDEAEGQVSR